MAGISLIAKIAGAFRSRVCLRAFLIVALTAAANFVIAAQVPSPASVLGFEPGDDRKIADWQQITDYFTRLDKASGRVAVKEFGRSTLGRPMIAVFISSPGNIKDLEKYRRISASLADPRNISREKGSELVAGGKTIVSISCSIHSTEIVASQMSMQLAYQLATASDAATREILDSTILILLPSANPDGIDIVADWYRKTLGTKSEGTAPPQLYHHYAGHDNNRDWFMMNLEETRAITKLYWQQWFPQIVYDVHQMGSSGPRFVIPPFYDPPNPRISPVTLRDVGVIGYKMAADLQARGIQGVATNTTFDTWWHGGFRSAPYYHNSIGILSEAASANLMTPIDVMREQLGRSRPARGLTSPLDRATNQPDPWQGGQWRPKDIVEIELTAARSLLEMAAKYRTRYLTNFYELNRKAAENVLSGDAQAFVIPAGQPNEEVIARFIAVLMWQGIEVHQLTKELYVKHDGGADFHEMPAGSFIILTSQPQRANVLSLFEEQIYPHRLNDKGEPDVPYDVAGWTLPLQMGVETAAVNEIRDRAKELTTLKKLSDANDARRTLNLSPTRDPFPKLSSPDGINRTRIGLYQGSAGSMDEGWTRLVFDMHDIKYTSVSDADIRSGNIKADVLILPSSSEAAIVNGLNAERYPQEVAGGIGHEGIERLKRFVDGGGRLVCFDDSCGLVIKHFGLPLRNVLDGVKRSEFYNPGSVVKLSVDTADPLAKGLREETAAYFINSSAFEATGDGVNIIARYAAKDTLLSGWMLGGALIEEKAALAETKFGKGSVVLFAFRPQHRGQTFATFPLLFNAVTEK